MTSPLRSQPSEARRLPEEEQEALGTDDGRQSSPEACFQVQAAVAGPELCEEVEGVAEGREITSSSASMRKSGGVQREPFQDPY